MGSGKPDYWYSMVPTKPILGATQFEWVKADSGNVGAGAFDDLINYEVPVGYKLNIVNGIVSCSGPGLKKCWLYGHAPAGITMYYDTTLQMPLSQSGTYFLDAGETIKIRVWNLDDIEQIFASMLVGFLELIIA